MTWCGVRWRDWRLRGEPRGPDSGATARTAARAVQAWRTGQVAVRPGLRGDGSPHDSVRQGSLRGSGHPSVGHDVGALANRGPLGSTPVLARAGAHPVVQLVANM